MCTTIIEPRPNVRKLMMFVLDTKTTEMQQIRIIWRGIWFQTLTPSGAARGKSTTPCALKDEEILHNESP